VQNINLIQISSFAPYPSLSTTISIMASPTLFTLESKGLKLDDVPSLSPHIAPLKSSTSFTEIRLNGNTFGVPASESLAAILSTQKNLQTANLADIFTSRLLSEIPPALSSLLTALLELPDLQNVDLSDNAFGLNTAAPLVEFLGKATPLRRLILNNNGLGPEAGTLVANSLAKLAEKKAEGPTEVRKLEKIICGRNRLETGSMAAWVKAYQVLGPGIREVKMTQNGIRQEGVKLLLSEGLSHAPGLEVLDLQDNTFTVLGATALAGVLPKWPKLKELGVSDCLLSARGAIRMFETLGKGGNKDLEVLRCQYGDIDTKGVKALLDAVKGGALPKLRRVELNGNKFSEDDPSIEALREILEERRKEADAEDDDDGNWGIDELDELEEESEEEEEEDEEAEEEEEKEESILKAADEAENETVAQEKDEEVDELAAKLGTTGI
jgi:Ran GTPase-activating protein 1